MAFKPSPALSIGTRVIEDQKMQKKPALSSHHGFEWIKGVFMKSFIKHSKGSLRVSLRGPALGPPKMRSVVVGQFQHYLLEWKLTVIVADCGRPSGI